jgi:ABC-2 type transport system permease protein
MYAAVLTPQFLLGAVAGIAMLAGAVWFRRWRDDS